jgi:hypothetical protein
VELGRARYKNLVKTPNIWFNITHNFKEILMDLPFQSAASPAAEPAFKKRLVVMDWDGTLCLPEPNPDLYLLATLATKKGHDVVIATMGSKSESMLETLTYIHPLFMKRAGLPGLDIYQELSEKIYYKPRLMEEIKTLGHDKAFIVFDNEPNTVPSYVRADFVGAVGSDGKVEDVLDLAVMLGVNEDFSAARQKLKAPASPGKAFE